MAPDLPGHGFTASVGSRQASLPGMAEALGELLRVLRLEPAYAVGHSAGAAILARMCLDGVIAPRALISFNGAFMPFGGLASSFFSPLAKLLALNPFAPRLLAWSASDRNSVARVIRDTGSTLDDEGLDLYARLFRDPRHVSGALRMMANWDLSTLAHDMRALSVPLTLVVGSRDRAVPPSQAAALAPTIPGATLVRMAGGHLAHEEYPQEAARIILDVASATRRGNGPRADSR